MPIDVQALLQNYVNTPHPYDDDPERYHYNEFFEKEVADRIKQGKTGEALEILHSLNNSGHSEYLIDYMRHYSVLPEAEAILRKAAEQNPSTVMKNITSLDRLPYGEELIHQAAIKAPKAAIEEYYSYNKKPYAQEMLAAAAAADPATALKYVYSFDSSPNAKKVIEKAAHDLAEKDPVQLLENKRAFRDQPYSAEVVARAVDRAIETNPASILPYTDFLLEQPNGTALVGRLLDHAVDKAPAPVFSLYLDHLLADKPYGNAILERAVKGTLETQPYLLLRNQDLYKDKPYAKEVLEQAVRKLADNNPSTLLSNHMLYASQPYASEVLEKAVRKLVDQTPTVLLQYASVYKGKPYAEEMLEKAARATAITNPIALIQSRDAIKDKPYAGDLLRKAYATESGAQMVVRGLNDRHEMPDAARFEALSHPPLNSADVLFDITTGGRAELYTSTYNGIFERFTKALTKEKKSITDLTDDHPERLDKLPVFIEAAAAYGKLDAVFAAIPDTRKDGVLNMLVERAAKGDFKYTVTLAETMTALQQKPVMSKADKAILAKLEDKLWDKYQNSQGDEHLRLGLAISHYATNAQNSESIQPKHRAAFIGLRENPTYKLPEVHKLSQEKLFEKDGKSYQSYTFYSDSDGKSSFDSLINSYGFSRDGGGKFNGANPNWKLDDKGEYICMRGKCTNGKEIVIYASKPEYEGTGPKAMDAASAAEQGREQGEKPHYNIVVHRGHSFHANATIGSIGQDTAFVFLGSCGGYQEINNVLRKAPDAQIVSTKGTGTMQVNDPLLKALNERLRDGQDLNWEQVWREDMGRIADARKNEYIRPDKNAAAILTQKYNSLKSGASQGLGQENSIAAAQDHNGRGHGGAHLPMQAPTVSGRHA